MVSADMGAPMDDMSQDAPALPSVTITDAGDGTYTVTMSDDESQEPQTAGSLDEAFSIVKQMFGAEDQEDPMTEPDGDGNAPLDPEAAKSAWDQLAAKKSKGGM